MSAAPPPGSPLDRWLDFISAQHPQAIALGLDRVREVFARLALPAFPPTFVVGGTNGKGSTCAYLESILRAAGYRTGLYTSPHILRYNERVRIAGENADDASLVRGFERVEAARAGVPLTYFEFGTLAAFVTFLEARVEAMVLEVGLGGRLDAVNIVNADCAIVTTVDLDHQAWLGNTREAIALEKAHIYRRGRPAFFGDRQAPESLADHAAHVGASLQVLGRDYRAQAIGAQWDFEGTAGAKRALPMPALRGSWQLGNAATALAALDAMADRLPVSVGEIRQGLTRVRLSGRLQVLPGRPQVVLDVAHNPHAARALATGLGEMAFAARTLAVFAVLADKDIDGVVAAMAARVDAWLVAPLQSERAASVESVMESLARHGLQKPVRAFASVPLAFEAARQMATPDDRILVFGSFHTVAAVLDLPR